MEKMTKKEMFAYIASKMVEDEAIVAFCKNEIALLEKKAAKAKETAVKKKAEGDELRDAVFAAMSDTEFETITDIASRIDGEDVTIAKITYRLTSLVRAGLAEKTEVTIPATETSKMRKVCAYRKIIG